MISSRPVRIALTMAVMLARGISFADTAAPFDAQLAREPAEVVTPAGRVFRGILDGVRDGRLHLRRAADGGEVGYSFAPDEIARLALPGSDLESDAFDLLEREERASALPMLEALARHRMRYLPVIAPAGRRVLWELVRHGGASGDPGTVAATIRALRPLAAGPDDELALTGCELELSLRQGPPEETRAVATRWCTLADPAGTSALGWRVCAQLAYSDGDYAHARWMALHPITFGAPVASRDLDACYAIAIAAADRLGDVAHARALAEEMRRRGIAWPAAAGMAGLDEHYADPDVPPTRTFFRLPAGPVLPPSRALRSLDSVRKLAVVPDPATNP